MTLYPRFLLTFSKNKYNNTKFCNDEDFLRAYAITFIISQNLKDFFYYTKYLPGNLENTTEKDKERLSTSSKQF